MAAVSYEDLAINLNSERSMDAAVRKISAVVLTSSPGARYPTYRFRLKTGGFANLIVEPVGFANMTMIAADSTHRFDRCVGEISKRSLSNLRVFIGKIAYLMSISDDTNGRALMPLRDVMTADGATAYYIETRNLAEPGTSAHETRRSMMRHAVEASRFAHGAVTLAVSSLQGGTDGRLYVMWNNAYSPSRAGKATEVVAPRPPASSGSDDDADEMPTRKRRTGDIANEPVTETLTELPPPPAIDDEEV